MLNTDITAAMLVSGIASGPASLAVNTANGLPDGKTKRQLLEMAKRQLKNLYLEAMSFEQAEEVEEAAAAWDKLNEDCRECGAEYRGGGAWAFPWGEILWNGAWQAE